MPPPVNLCNVQELKLASRVHGGGWQELEGLLVFERLGIKQGGEGLEFEGKVVGCVLHVGSRVG